MTSLRTLLACVALLLGAGVPTAFAQCPGPCGPPGTPCPATSTFPSLIVGGGSCVAGRTAVPYVVHVRDLNGISIPNIPVILQFPVGAGTHGNTLQAAGQIVDCATARLIRPTNVDGVAVFYPQFFGCLNTPSVQVIAGATCLGFARARSTDAHFSPNADVDLADLSAFSNAYLFPIPFQPCFDFDDNGVVGLPDLTIETSDYLNALPSAYCSPGW